MSSVFISLYLDEDVNVLVADLLKARGFDAITARDAGKLHATDAEQFTYALSQARTQDMRSHFNDYTSRKSPS